MIVLRRKRNSVYAISVSSEEEMAVKIRQLDLMDLAPCCPDEYEFICVGNYGRHSAAHILRSVLIKS